MNADVIRRVLRALMPGQAASRALVVQHLGFERPDLDTLPMVLDDVGRELGVALTLDGVGGDVVLADRAFVARVAPQVLHAFLEDRPLVTVAHAADAPEDLLRRTSRLHAEIVRQLREIADGGAPAATVELRVTTLPPNSGFDADFDSKLHAQQLAEAELDPDRAELLNRLRRGLVDPLQPVLHASYCAHASLTIDFAVGLAQVDELADQRLRVARELPYLARRAAPGKSAQVRSVNALAWDLALAAGDFRLLHSPVNWWHAPLLVHSAFDVAPYTRLPRHLDMARCLAAGPLSPAQLQRQARVSLRELRGFLQACLFLGLVHWLPRPGEVSPAGG